MKNTTEVAIESMLTMVTGLEIGSVEDEDDEDEDLPLTNNGITVNQIKILNAVTFIVVLALNGLAATGKFSEYSVGEVSKLYPTKITPGSGAFSIWSVIYTLETLFVLYGLFGYCIWPTTKSEDNLFLHGIGWWYAILCLFNSLWIITFVQGNDTAVWFSTILIIGLLFCLCKIYININAWKRKHSGGFLQRCISTLLFDVHFSMYAGWVTVATIVNISVALTTTGWDGKPFTDSALTVIMLCVALFLNSYIVITREDCVWGFVLSWASAWIADANTDDKTINTGAIVISSIIGVISTLMTAKVLHATCVSRNSVEDKKMLLSTGTA